MNYNLRCVNDLVIISTIPHYLALFFISKDIYYSFLILISSSSSVLWHLYEHDLNLYYIDHTLAVLLSLYEIIIDNNNENIYFNLLSFLTCHFMHLLVSYKIMSYNYSHSIFHIVSSCKTIYIASKN